MSGCKQWREGDEYACTCGYRWDVKGEDPHPKKPEEHIAKIKQDLKRCKRT